MKKSCFAAAALETEVFARGRILKPQFDPWSVHTEATVRSVVCASVGEMNVAEQ